MTNATPLHLVVSLLREVVETGSINDLDLLNRILAVLAQAEASVSPPGASLELRAAAQ